MDVGAKESTCWRRAYRQDVDVTYTSEVTADSTVDQSRKYGCLILAVRLLALYFVREDGDNTFLRNVSGLLLSYTVVRPSQFCPAHVLVVNNGYVVFRQPKQLRQEEGAMELGRSGVLSAGIAVWCAQRSTFWHLHKSGRKFRASPSTTRHFTLPCSVKIKCYKLVYVVPRIPVTLPGTYMCFALLLSICI